MILCNFGILSSNGGGGGERVLWQAIEAILKDDHLSTFADIVIYSGESVSSSVIFDNVQVTFNMSCFFTYNNIN